MKINFQGKDEKINLVDLNLSFKVNENSNSTLRVACLEIIVEGRLQLEERHYTISCKHFYDADRLCFYNKEAIDGIVRKYKSDIINFYTDAIMKNFDFSLAQKNGHLVLENGWGWQKKQKRDDFKVIDDGSCVACGRL